MNKKQGNTSLLIGGIVIIATIAIYLMSTHNIFKYPMCWLALVFIVFSEMITTFLCWSSKGSPIKVAVAVVGVLQTLITISSSLFFINVLIFEYLKFITLYLITFVIFAIIIVILMKFSSNRDVENKELKDAKVNMLMSRSVVQSIINSESGKAYVSSLKKLDENLRFTDDSVIHSMDLEIYGKIKELSENLTSEDVDVEKAITNINDLINQRNFMVQNEKSYR